MKNPDNLDAKEFLEVPLINRKAYYLLTFKCQKKRHSFKVHQSIQFVVAKQNSTTNTNSLSTSHIFI